MGKQAHFKVVGRLDSAGRVIPGTVTINRGAGLFTVRPLRRRKTYELPLSAVADMVVARLVRLELREKQLVRAARRKARGLR